MDSAGCIRQHGYVDLRRNELMDTRFIIYFVFICLKNFELSWVVCRINKVIRMNFVELGTITAFSEIAGFCFIVSRSQSADFLLWWKETVFFGQVCLCWRICYCGRCIYRLVDSAFAFQKTAEARLC